MKNRKLMTALILLLCLALSACGASGDSGAMMDAPQASTVPQVPEMDYEGRGGPSSDGEYGFVEEAPNGTGGSYYDNTKIIRTADLSLQSTEFDTAVEALNALVSQQKGYYESSDFSYGGYSSSGNRWGEFTIRVPKENFDAFLSAIGDVAHVVSRNTGIQDVGEAYYDAELRLQTLETKHERLLALLERAELMEDIIDLESALSDVEYEIQQYKSTLTRYDALIDFSTIRIELQEVTRVSDTPAQADPFYVRLGAAFSEGWNDFCDGLEDFALWAAYDFMGILIFLAVVVLAVLVLVKLRRRRRNRRMQEAVMFQAPPVPSSPPEEPKDGKK